MLDRRSTMDPRRDNFKEEEVVLGRGEAEEAMGREIQDLSQQTNRYPGIQSPTTNHGYWYTRSWADDSFIIRRKTRASGAYQTS